MGGRLTSFWREYVYNDDASPTWGVHPHERYRLLSRIVVVCLGSALPIGMALLGSGVLRRIEEGTQQVGLQFYGVLIVLFAAWLLGVINAVTSEQKHLMHYAALGSVYPANMFVIGLALQAIN